MVKSSPASIYAPFRICFIVRPCLNTTANCWVKLWLFYIPLCHCVSYVFSLYICFTYAVHSLYYYTEYTTAKQSMYDACMQIVLFKLIKLIELIFYGFVYDCMVSCVMICVWKCKLCMKISILYYTDVLFVWKHQHRQPSGEALRTECHTQLHRTKYTEQPYKLGAVNRIACLGHKIMV